MIATDTLHIWTDGGSRGNPGQAAIGIIIKTAQDQLLSSYGHYLGNPISNNQAEYQALYQALLRAKELQANHLLCHLDSQLVVEQINGRYKIKDPGLKQWWTAITQLLQQFTTTSIVYVPRAQNALADAMVNRILDRVEVGQTDDILDQHQPLT